MPTWHTDRIVLLGDSAWGVTLYSLMGASSGLAGADLLGTALRRNEGNSTRALREWEQRMRPFIATRQMATVPGGKRGLMALNARKAGTRSMDVAAP
ncbi:hypothetical protein [Streptomyces phaeochromogenes]